MSALPTPTLHPPEPGANMKAALKLAFSIVKVAGRWIERGLFRTLGSDWIFNESLRVPEVLSRTLPETLEGREISFEEAFPPEV